MVGNPEAIALRYFAAYAQKWFSFDISPKCLQRLFLGIDFRFSRAKGATHEALLFLIAAFCRLAQSLSHFEQVGFLVGAVGIDPETLHSKNAGVEPGGFDRLQNHLQRRE
jgi:hypothetical protein